MKKKTLLLVGILSMGISYAQVGINTQNPQGVFHVDAKSDTNGTTGTGDDIIVTSRGYMGIGTIEPKERLDLRGTIRIVDGNQGTGNIFTAIDTNGTGTWKPANTSAVIGTCTLRDQTRNYYSTYDEQIVYGSSSITMNNSQIALSIADEYKLTVPTGKYLVFINQDVSNAEYGTLRLRNVNDPSEIIYEQTYAEWLAGTCFIWFVSSPATIYVTWQARDMNTVSNGYYLGLSTDVYRTITTTFTFLSLT